MAFSLLSLFDDVASLLDDVSMMTKVAVKKTGGVIGDDLALNAESLSGLNPDKELPIIYKVAKGSLVNKAILVPLALLLSAYLPFLITPLLILGGLFLCYEGVEKVLEKLFGTHQTKEQITVSEDEKIKGAIRTDFILSAEIIIISLGAIQSQPILTKSIVLSVIAFFITIFIYGVVAIIVKLDDLGLKIMKTYTNKIAQKIGYSMVVSVPYIMKVLAIVGTIAMFSVGGGIIGHSLPFHISEQAILGGITNITIGIVSGLLVVGMFKIIKKIKNYYIDK